MSRGIYFRNGIAYIRFKDQDGKIARESTEQRSRKFALDLLAKRKTEVAEGRHFPTRQFDRVMFGGLLDDWWEKHGKQTRSRFNYHLPKVRERFGDRRARDIQPDDVEAFLADLAKEELAASTINKYRTILCSTFNFAVRREKFDRNPVSVVPQRKEPPGRDRFLAPEDFRKFLDEMPRRSGTLRVCLAGRLDRRPQGRNPAAKVERTGNGGRCTTHLRAANQERAVKAPGARRRGHPRASEVAQLPSRRIRVSR
jgi:Phage integrase, N-terminal SAM-like domain